MTSYRFAPNPRNRIAARFMGKVGREIQKAFAEEKEDRGITQNQVARLLGVDRAVVSRQLKGHTNLTARTIADYAWVFNRDLEFAMPKRKSSPERNYLPNEAQTEDDAGLLDEPSEISAAKSIRKVEYA